MIVLTNHDELRAREVADALRARGTHGKDGRELDAGDVVSLAVLLVYRMAHDEVARLVDNVPIGPLGVWAAKPPARVRRPTGGA